MAWLHVSVPGVSSPPLSGGFNAAGCGFCHYYQVLIDNYNVLIVIYTDLINNYKDVIVILSVYFRNALCHEKACQDGFFMVRKSACVVLASLYGRGVIYL